MEKKKIIVGVIDGQGASVGKYIVERLRDRLPGIYIRGLGTTSLATGKMLKVGADDGASGENAIVFNSGRVDILMGVVAILMPNALLGEITPKMAEAIGNSPAQKILLPLDHSNITIAMAEEHTFHQRVEIAVERVVQYCKETFPEEEIIHKLS